MSSQIQDIAMPNGEGRFGEYGGRYVPPELEKILVEITTAYNTLKDDPSFKEELYALYKDYVGRPSPVTHARNLSNKIGGAQIYL